MVINNNPMNPVPLWPSKNYWYCKKVTNHGAECPVVLTKGALPSMHLTLGSTDIPQREVSLNVLHNGTSEIFTGTLGVNGANVSHTVLGAIVENISISANKDRDKFSVTFSIRGSHSVLPPREFQMYDANNNIYFDYATLRSGVVLHNETIELSFSIEMVVYTDLVVRLYKYNDEQVGNSFTITNGIFPVPQSLQVSDRYAYMIIVSQTLTGIFDEGMYYITIEDEDEIVRYSEPFMWLSDVSSYLLTMYRRSEPVVTTDNYMSFSSDGVNRSMYMYIPGRLIMPPFVFNDEVDEIDGRKYTRKQVSYKDEKCEFMCTAYFAEAIRLLWHCDIRYAGSMRVEYMVRPEIDWNTDNHLCNVTLEFQGDTVMQTNGTASAYGDSSDNSHQSYDASFDASFN